MEQKKKKGLRIRSCLTGAIWLAQAKKVIGTSVREDDIVLADLRLPDGESTTLLQWVLIPRMHDLLDNKQPLPGAFAVAPYYEMALATDHPQRALILAELEKLDALCADEAS